MRKRTAEQMVSLAVLKGPTQMGSYEHIAREIARLVAISPRTLSEIESALANVVRNRLHIAEANRQAINRFRLVTLKHDVDGKYRLYPYRVAK